MTRIWVAARLIILVVVVVLAHRAPSWLAAAYVLFGGLAGLLCYLDKNAAREGRWRISEASLHLTDLLGGIVGGLLAQYWLRHKTRKARYAATTWSIAAIHAIALLALLAGIVDPAAIDIPAG